jgi:CubicO group peptidase (beta-lactamase class C family)
MRFPVLAAALLVGMTQAQGKLDLTSSLEGLRAQFNLPSLSAAAVLGGDVIGAAAVGRLSADGDANVTPSSAYQLGSISKSVTATMIARLVERGLLRWDSTLGEVLGDITMREEYKSVTLEALLSHRSGVVDNVAPPNIADLSTARKTYLETALAQPRGKPEFLYSNVGYVAAAVMAEKVTGKPWADLVRAEIFQPLAMGGCDFGFGVAGDPLPHVFTTFTPRALPMNSGNPRVLDGADQIRCPLASFARYVAAHLTGERGGSTLLKPETWKRLHTDPFGKQYALGWLTVANQPWARGVALTHAGSNTLNFAVVWLAPARGVAVVVATNIGRDEANRLDRVGGAANAVVLAVLPELFKLAP